MTVGPNHFAWCGAKVYLGSYGAKPIAFTPSSAALLRTSSVSAFGSGGAFGGSGTTSSVA